MNPARRPPSGGGSRSATAGTLAKGLGTLLATVGLASVPVLAAEKLKPEEVIRRHLEAVGAAEAGVSPRSIAGSCALRTLASQVLGVLVGRFRFDSAADGSALTMQFPSDRYPKESFVFDDGRPEVGFAQPGRRSGLARFVAANPIMLTEGLLGGVLNASWPLFNLAEGGARAKYDGLKKVEGREVHRLSYRARKGQGDLGVFLFFEPDTFRHVGSLYKTSQSQSMGTRLEQSSTMNDVYFQVQEGFSDWKAVNGVILPATWTIQYQILADTNESWKYELTADSFDK